MKEDQQTGAKSQYPGRAVKAEGRAIGHEQSVGQVEEKEGSIQCATSERGKKRSDKTRPERQQLKRKQGGGFTISNCARMPEKKVNKPSLPISGTKIEEKGGGGAKKGRDRLIQKKNG